MNQIAEESFFDFGKNDATRGPRKHNSSNNRCIPCPSCREPNCLTSAERSRGYVCADCCED